METEEEDGLERYAKGRYWMWKEGKGRVLGSLRVLEGWVVVPVVARECGRSTVASHHANILGLKSLWDVQRKPSRMQSDMLASRGGP